MIPLNPNQLQILAEKLQTLRRDLLAGAEQRQIAAATVELDQTSVGRLSRMDAIQLQALAQAADRRAAEQVVRVRAALQRIEEGSYGTCIDCDEPVGIQRLVSDPCALYCLECQKARDQEQVDAAHRLRNQGRHV